MKYQQKLNFGATSPPLRRSQSILSVFHTSFFFSSSFLPSFLFLSSFLAFRSFLVHFSFPSSSLISFVYIFLITSFSHTGRSIATFAKKQKGVKASPSSHFKALPGRGIRCRVNGKRIRVGNRTLMEENSVSVSSKLDKTMRKYEDDGKTYRSSLFFLGIRA